MTNCRSGGTRPMEIHEEIPRKERVSSERERGGWKMTRLGLRITPRSAFSQICSNAVDKNRLTYPTRARTASLDTAYSTIFELFMECLRPMTIRSQTLAALQPRRMGKGEDYRVGLSTRREKVGGG
eukprot:450510-Amorphochlora_amoeboformis.AAC.3